MKIRAIGFIAEILGTREFTVRIQGKVKISDLVKLPDDIHDKLIVLVNGSPADLNFKVENGDEVVLMPMISGG